MRLDYLESLLIMTIFLDNTILIFIQKDFKLLKNLLRVQKKTKNFLNLPKRIAPSPKRMGIVGSLLPPSSLQGLKENDAWPFPR